MKCSPAKNIFLNCVPANRPCIKYSNGKPVQNNGQDSSVFLGNTIIPVMLRIPSFHLAAYFRPCIFPESCKIIRDLKRPAGGRKQFNKDRDTGDTRSFKAAEYLLDYYFKHRPYLAAVFFI